MAEFDSHELFYLHCWIEQRMKTSVYSSQIQILHISKVAITYNISSYNYHTPLFWGC